jgi:hypothetical protein
MSFLLVRLALAMAPSVREAPIAFGTSPATFPQPACFDS